MYIYVISLDDIGPFSSEFEIHFFYFNFSHGTKRKSSGESNESEVSPKRTAKDSNSTNPNVELPPKPSNKRPTQQEQSYINSKISKLSDEVEKSDSREKVLGDIKNCPMKIPDIVTTLDNEKAQANERITEVENLDISLSHLNLKLPSDDEDKSGSEKKVLHLYTLA